VETARGATWLDEQLSTGRLEEERTSKELLDAAAKRRIALRQMGIAIGDKERLSHQSLEQLKAMDIREAGEALENAVIEKSREFTLVPWRPIMERRRGQSIIGRASTGGGISWDVRDRQRDRGLSI